MKANIKKYNFIIFSIVLLFIAFYCTVSNAQPSESITRINSECTGNGTSADAIKGILVDTSPTGPFDRTTYIL